MPSAQNLALARESAHDPLTKAKRAKTIADKALVRAAVNFDAAERRAALAEATYNAIRDAARAE